MVSLNPLKSAKNIVISSLGGGALSGALLAGSHVQRPAQPDPKTGVVLTAEIISASGKGEFL